MSSSAKEWIFVALFFAMFFAVSISEILWLYRSKGIDLRRTLLTVFLPNFLTITLGFLVTFVVFGILFAVAWDENTTMPGGDAAAWTLVVIGLLFPLLLLTGLKFLLVRVLKFTSISERFKNPFGYSIISSLIFFLAVIGIPCLYIFLF